MRGAPAAGGRAPDGPPPAAEATTVAASAASSSRSGSSPGIVRASSVLPEPGGRSGACAWPPARAISSARRRESLAADVGEVDDGVAILGRRLAGRADRVSATLARGSGDGRLRRDLGARTASAASTSVATGTGSTPGDERGLGGRARGHDDPADPAPRRAPSPSAGAQARAGPRRRAPSSPISADPAGPTRSCSDPSRIPIAIARSSDAPVLRSSAGARLTVIRRGGWWNPALRSAPRTRSRASEAPRPAARRS